MCSISQGYNKLETSYYDETKLHFIMNFLCNMGEKRKEVKEMEVNLWIFGSF